MANKKPKTASSQPEVTVKQQQVAAVNADTDTSQKKSKKQQVKKKSDKPNIFKRMWKGIKGIFSELKKVSWPKGKEVGSNTAVVLLVVVLFFIVLFVIDYVLGGLLGLITDGEWRTLFI